MDFSAVEKQLFFELVIQTIITLGVGRRDTSQRHGRKLEDPAAFAPGDYVGGQTDMSNDQEIHEMLECCGAIGPDLRLRFDQKALRMHLCDHAEGFGVDLAWTIECFLSSVAQWHFDGWDHAFFYRYPFWPPAEYERLIELLIEADCLRSSDGQLHWSGPMVAMMGLARWGIFTEEGAAARDEIRAIWRGLPPHWKSRVSDSSSVSGVYDDLAEALSNHWYRGRWNEAPIRGDKGPVYPRFYMSERAAYLWQMVHGKVEYHIDDRN